MLYHPPTGSTDPNAPFLGKNVAAGIQGSKVPPGAIEMVQREIVNAILAAGLTPTDNDLTQLVQAISTGLFLGAFSGTANALTAALPALMPEPGSAATYQIPVLVPGMRVHGIIGPNTNTGPVTFAVAGFATAYGAKPARKGDGVTELSAGDLKPGTIATLVWDGTVFRISGSFQSDTSNQLATLKSLQNIQQFRNSTRTILSGSAASVLAWTPTSPSGVSSYAKRSATSNLMVFMELINFTTGLGAAIVNLNIGPLSRQSVASVGVPNYISIGQIPKIDLITAADLGNPAAGTGLPLSIYTSRPDGQSWSQTMNPTTADSNQFPPATASTSVLIIGEIEPTA